MLTVFLKAPATKVPGLVFCAGQTATGEIKAATVCLTFPIIPHYTPIPNRFTEKSFTEPQRSP